jgi:DNA-binding NarL/FixJ family response regulator
MSNLAAPIRIVLIEPYTLVREGLAALLKQETTFRIVGEAGSVRDALALIAREQPDIVLFEPADLDEGRATLIDQMRAAAPEARLIMMTHWSDVALHQSAVQRGVMGIVLKTQTAETLTKAITRVYSGEAWVDRSMVASVITRMARNQDAARDDPEKMRIALLSPREIEIVRLIARGLKNKVIAKQMCISEHTVRHHLTSIFSKLQVSDRLELMIFAYRHGLGDLPRGN